MLQEGQNAFAQQIGRRCLKAGIAIVGLVLLRYVLTQLPMMEHADSMFIGSLFGASDAEITTLNLVKAIIDTIIFAVALFAAVDTAALVRSSVQRLPESGTMLLLVAVVAVVALAYSAYSNTIQPIIGDESVYDWLFLILGILPVIALGVLVYRNLDTITDVVWHSGGRAVKAATTSRSMPVVTCGNCGKALTMGSRFCASCGTAPMPQSAPELTVFCSMCGAKNVGSAHSCASCGKPLAKMTV